LQRALDTAAPLAKVLGVDVTAMAAFNEIAMGTWDGLPFEMIRSNDPASYEARGRHFGSFRVPGGESFEDVADRAVRALKVLVTEKDPLLVFTHAGVIRATVCRLIGHPMNELFDIPAGNVRCTLIDGAHGELTVVATNVDPTEVSSLITDS
jgi:probable phosphoglycerate mutase